MRLTDIRWLDELAGSDGVNPLAHRALESWDSDQGSARFIRSSANFVFTFRRGGTPHFLRLSLDRERSRSAIEAELGLVVWLRSEDVPVPAIVPSRDGSEVVTLDGGEGLLHAVVFTAASGVQRDLIELTSADIRAWGAALGRLHAALRRYPRAGSAARESFRDQLDFAEAQIGDDPLVRAELEAIRAGLAALPVDRANFGLIHGDFELDNLFWNGAISCIIDFDGCVFHWFTADVVFALEEPLEEDDAALDPFLAGYTAHAPLDARIWASAELLSRSRELLRHATIVRALDLSPDEVIPEWLQTLQNRLELRRAAYRESLARRPPPTRL